MKLNASAEFPGNAEIPIITPSTGQASLWCSLWVNQELLERLKKVSEHCHPLWDEGMVIKAGQTALPVPGQELCSFNSRLTLLVHPAWVLLS